MSICPYCGFRVKRNSGNLRKIRGTNTWAHKRDNCPKLPKVYVSGPRYPRRGGYTGTI